MASCRRLWPRTICDLATPPRVILGSSIGIVPADGGTTARRIRINRRDDESARCRGSRALGQPKDFSLSTPRYTTHSTFNAMSFQQERTEPSGPRRCRRGTKLSPRRKIDAPEDLLRAQFGNVTEPSRMLADL